MVSVCTRWMKAFVSGGVTRFTAIVAPVDSVPWPLDLGAGYGCMAGNMLSQTNLVLCQW